MSNVYLVALLISNATGHVESIETMEAVTQGGCMNMARQMHAANKPTKPGYELKLTCGTREALESALADHNCRVVTAQSDKRVPTTNYACDPSLKNRLTGWVKAVF